MAHSVLGKGEDTEVCLHPVMAPRRKHVKGVLIPFATPSPHLPSIPRAPVTASLGDGAGGRGRAMGKSLTAPQQ